MPPYETWSGAGHYELADAAAGRVLPTFWWLVGHLTLPLRSFGLWRVDDWVVQRMDAAILDEVRRMKRSRRYLPAADPLPLTEADLLPF